MMTTTRFMRRLAVIPGGPRRRGADLKTMFFDRRTRPKALTEIREERRATRLEFETRNCWKWREPRIYRG